MINKHLDYNLCTLVIVVSGYLCIYIQFKLFFGYTLPPMLKCPVRNNSMCPVRNALFFFNNDAHATFFNPSLHMLVGVLLSNLMIQVIRQYLTLLKERNYSMQYRDLEVGEM